MFRNHNKLWIWAQISNDGAENRIREFKDWKVWSNLNLKTCSPVILNPPMMLQSQQRERLNVYRKLQIRVILQLLPDKQTPSCLIRTRRRGVWTAAGMDWPDPDQQPSLRRPAGRGNQSCSSVSGRCRSDGFGSLRFKIKENVSLMIVK